MSLEDASGNACLSETLLYSFLSQPEAGVSAFGLNEALGPEDAWEHLWPYYQ